MKRKNFLKYLDLEKLKPTIAMILLSQMTLSCGKTVSKFDQPFKLIEYLPATERNTKDSYAPSNQISVNNQQQTETTQSDVSSISFTDIDLREGYISGEVNFFLSEPSAVRNVALRFLNETTGAISETVIASSSVISRSMSLKVVSTSIPSGASALSLEITPTTALTSKTVRQPMIDRTPKNVPGIQFWVMPDRGVLNHQGSEAAAGEKVATWQDQSGQNRHLAQSIDARRPTYHRTGSWSKAGLPAVRFEGYWAEGNNLEWNYSYTLPATWIIAAKYSGKNQGQHSLLGSQTDLEHYIDVGSDPTGRWMGPSVEGLP